MKVRVSVRNGKLVVQKEVGELEGTWTMIASAPADGTCFEFKAEETDLSKFGRWVLPEISRAVNEMNIETMPAGRKMDGLIHHKVMGLGVHWACARSCCPENPSDAMTSTPVPCYSTDMGPAWRVAEKLGISVGQMRHDGGDEPNTAEWAASKGSLEGIYYENMSVGGTAELAICRAALKGIELSEPTSGKESEQKSSSPEPRSQEEAVKNVVLSADHEWLKISAPDNDYLVPLDKVVGVGKSRNTDRISIMLANGEMMYFGGNVGSEIMALLQKLLMFPKE